MNIGILLILIITAIATSSIGVFLVLRKMSMLVDAISHTVLLGIVLAFMIVKDLSSPLLILGATLMGIFTVILTELLVKTKKTQEDSAAGLIYPLLFSIAVIIISTSFKNVHLDIDAVLLGKIEFAPFDELYINGVSIGPKLLYIMIVVMIINLLFIKIFFKELKIISFDSALAATLGFSPIIIHYLLMSLVSLTAVTSFNAVGSILVVALMIGPPATAVLFTKDLKQTLFVAILVGVINSILGYFLALVINVNIAGMIATTTLITFLIVLIFNPKNGIITTIIKKSNQKDDFDFLVLVFHLSNSDNKEINSKSNLMNNLNWDEKKLNKLINKGKKAMLIDVNKDKIFLTQKGYTYHQEQVLSLFNE